MDFVRATQKIETGKGIICAGDVFLVDHRLGGWKVIGGRLDGCFLQDREIEIVPEFLELKRERDELRKELEGVGVEEFYSIRERAGELQRELNELRAHLERRKPVLPRKVAEVIEKKRCFGENFILWKSSRENAKEDEDFSVLFEFVDKGDNIFVLADALRYGYTVKEPTIREEIEAIIEDCGGDRGQLTERLADLFQTRLEQEKTGQSG